MPTPPSLTVKPLGAALMLLVIATPAAAFGGLFEVNIATSGCVNGAFLDAPVEETLDGSEVDPSYPGWAGVGGCFGGFFEPRLVLGSIQVGLEVGVIYSSSQGSGEVALNGGPERTLTLRSTDLIVPIHARVTLPVSTIFGVTLGLGVDFSRPLTATLDGGDLGVAVAERDPTTYLGFQVGFEFSIPGINLSIPLNIRGRYNARLGDSYDGRLSQAADPTTYIPEWEWQTELHLGVAYSFLIF